MSNKKCIYIRQFHTMRPYIPVIKIPNFDATRLPFWDIYIREGVESTIMVGGTMGGEYTAGLSGGQRKLLLFELICQRTTTMNDQSDLLIVLDEPFSGVTDDFIPYIVNRLNRMRQTHNIVLVTNDHVERLTNMADNIILVSAIDRTVVKVNDMDRVDRQRAIFALSMVGDDYHVKTTDQDLKFFLDVEVWSSQALEGIFVFSLFCFGFFALAFWRSNEDQAVLVLVAGAIVSYFCVNPYLLSLVEWRNAMDEEAEALMHSSKTLNRALKSTLTVLIILIISFSEFGIVNFVISGLSSFKFWAGMFTDSAATTFPLICLGVYTRMDFQSVQIVGSLSFLLMIFLSTTFSPGAGIPVVKELRYVFSRYYFWCIVPGVENDMEGCPNDEGWIIVYMFLSSLAGVFVFLLAQFIAMIRNKGKETEQTKLRESMMDQEFAGLQISLYGEKALHLM